MLRKLALLCAIAGAGSGEELRRVVIVDIDGVRWDTFQQTYLDHRLPNFERILGTVSESSGFHSAAVFENATTVFPTVTMAAQASIFTGVFPGRHGIPGNAWFDRTTTSVIDYMTPNSLACVYGAAVLIAGCEGGMANQELESPTLYEFAARAGKTSTVVSSQYYKGATTPVLPSLDDVLIFLQGYALDPAAFDTRMMDRALESLNTSAWPDILTIYFAGADETAHVAGIAAQHHYFEQVIDPQFGRLLNELALHDADWETHTLFIITSDHGRTDLEVHPEDEDLAYRIDLDLARVTGPSGIQMVVDGGMAYVYLTSESQLLASAYELATDPALDTALDSVLVRATPGGGYHLALRGHNLTRLSSRSQAFLNDLDSARTGDIILLLKEGHYFGNGGHGSNHGSIFAGDLGVPLILAQGGIVPMRSDAAVSTTQIVATIAAYLDFPAEGLSPALPGLTFKGGVWNR